MKLLFDFGGVLVDLDKSRCIQAFQKLGFDILPYLGTYAQGGFFSELERGLITVPEFCQKLREVSGLDITDNDIIEAWKQYLTTVPEERLEMLLKAKQHYPLYVLSNTNSIHWDMARNQFFHYKGLEVEDFFEKVFLSNEIHAEKPSPAIYQAVIEGIGGKAEDILFFDDCETNCEGARACGMQARLAPANSLWLNYFDQNGKLNSTTEEAIKQLL